MIASPSTVHLEPRMERIIVKNFADGTSLFTINRESRRNAICSKTAIELQEAFREFDRSAQKVAEIGRAHV